MKLAPDLLLAASGGIGHLLTHPSDCNVYFIDAGSARILIDSGTGMDVDGISLVLNQWGYKLEEITDVLLTHLHADHAGGAAEIKRRSDAAVWCPASGAAVLREGDETAVDLPKAKKNGFYPADYQLASCPVDHEITDGEKFQLGNCRIHTLAVPGHSLHCHAYLMQKPDGPARLFAGDTVFSEGKISMIATHDFDFQALQKSMEKLLQSTRCDQLLAGHGPPVMRKGYTAVETAAKAFRQMRVPENIL